MGKMPAYGPSARSSQHSGGPGRRYERAGLAADWQCVVNEVRAEHRRKTGFMSRFNEVVAGLDSSKKRSFLERAKVSWGMPQAEGKQ
jgi:hypothetical protein